ncbi:MAG: PGDYG domain-containing protein [Sphingomonas sp.]|uniref:hypothetical protein n=1 Tax=Sphingomonas sp. TaxID=28214 RepID=UPI0035A844DF|nr:PGDYG domain-containing protein [Sphingomonas sp.]
MAAITRAFASVVGSHMMSTSWRIAIGSQLSTCTMVSRLSDVIQSDRDADGQEYRKTATIRATQWHKPGDHPAVVMKSAPDRYADNEVPWIETFEGGHIVTPGDWIATGVQGEHWPIKPDIFAATYEPVGAAHHIASEAALRERVAVLEGALEPFAKIARTFSKQPDGLVTVQMDFCHLRAALRALAAQGSE